MLKTLLLILNIVCGIYGTYFAAIVAADGSIMLEGTQVYSAAGSVRPVIVMRISAED